MTLTHREKNFLKASAIVLLFVSLFEQKTLDSWEIFYLILIVVPLGFYIGLDPERRSQK